MPTIAKWDSKLKITISGPPASGKTLTLERITRSLKRAGFKIGQTTYKGETHSVQIEVIKGKTEL